MRKIDKSEILATRYKAWIDDKENENHPRYYSLKTVRTGGMSLLQNGKQILNISLPGKVTRADR